MRSTRSNTLPAGTAGWLAVSRLYLDNTYTRVGASWLTREDRDAEIADFTGYLNALYDQVLDGRDPAALHISLLGFSQGAATACRCTPRWGTC